MLEPFTLYSESGRAYRIHSFGGDNIVLTRFDKNRRACDGGLVAASVRPASCEELQMFQMLERSFAIIADLEKKVYEGIAELGDALALAPELADVPLALRADRLRDIRTLQENEIPLQT